MLSLILPSLNVAPYIEECVESALAQTLMDIQIICVDGGSDDGTIELLRHYEAQCRDGRWPGKSLQVHVCDRRSYGYQVNIGLSLATHKYVAILETDDFVVPQMYEELVVLSEKWNLDYIRGEYDFFTTDEDGTRSYKHVHHYAPVGEVLTSTRSERIMTFDQNLWKGIYRRAFLQENNIRLNESAGAAFQDIGFNMQVFSYATRAYYIDKSFYRYRRDRNASSIHSLACFQFYAQELSFLHELDPEGQLLYWPGIYERFACALSGELSKAATQNGIMPDSPMIAPFLSDLIQDFRNAIGNNIWPSQTTPQGQITSIQKIIADPMLFAEQARLKAAKKVHEVH